MSNCKKCGYPIMPPGVPYGYAGPVCAYGGHHPTYQPLPHDAGSHDQYPGARPARYLTEEDVIRLIDEKLKQMGLPPTTHEGTT